MLTAGIVGLANVGKSTLFNAVTRTHKAETGNYPFCTIDPNIGMAIVPDPRLEVLQGILKTKVAIPTVIEFIDIAGLVAGASKGAGLGNQFLAKIREVDAILHTVRCFDDPDVVHGADGIDPARDIEIVNTELILADIASLERRHERNAKKARGGDKEAQAENMLIGRLIPHLNENRPAITFTVHDDEAHIMRDFFLLSAKPVIHAVNVAEGELSSARENSRARAVEKYARERHAAACVVISARIEAELADLPPEEAKAFLAELGVEDSGISTLIRAVYDLLGLRTFFTNNENEVRAWTIRKGTKAPQAAGAIHGDFEKGFIKAEVVSFDDLARLGSIHAARDAGKYRMEGKEYVFHDGDVAYFRFAT